MVFDNVPIGGAEWTIRTVILTFLSGVPTATPPGRDIHGRDRRQPRRQVRPRIGAGVPHRHPGAGPPADDPAPARCRGGARHGGLCHRLSRLAAGRPRPADAAGQALPRTQRYRVPRRRERGHGRDGCVGHPAAQPVPRREEAGRLRHVVRQGSGRRPLGRRLQARQPRRHLAPWRRIAARRR